MANFTFYVDRQAFICKVMIEYKTTLETYDNTALDYIAKTISINP